MLDDDHDSDDSYACENQIAACSVGYYMEQKIHKICSNNLVQLFTAAANMLWIIIDFFL